MVSCTPVTSEKYLPIGNRPMFPVSLRKGECTPRKARFRRKDVGRIWTRGWNRRRLQSPHCSTAVPDAITAPGFGRVLHLRLLYSSVVRLYQPGRVVVDDGLLVRRQRTAGPVALSDPSANDRRLPPSRPPDPVIRRSLSCADQLLKSSQGDAEERCDFLR